MQVLKTVKVNQSNQWLANQVTRCWILSIDKTLTLNNLEKLFGNKKAPGNMYTPYNTNMKTFSELNVGYNWK